MAAILRCNAVDERRTPDRRETAEIAERRGQSLAQMALAWALRDPRMTSLVVGASSVKQLETNVGALERLDFTSEELAEIDRFATDADIDLWARSSGRRCRTRWMARTRSGWRAVSTSRTRPWSQGVPGGWAAWSLR